MSKYPIWRLARFLGALFWTSLRAATALRAAFAMQVAFMALNNLVFFVFWWILLERVPDVRGWRLPEMAVLFGVVAAGFGLGVTFGGGVHKLGRLIQDGELDALLTQPKPTLLYLAGSRTQASGIGDAASGVALLIASGEVGLAELPYVASAVLASALAIVASRVIFFSLSFWLGEVDNTARQLSDALVTFSLYPEPLFGGPLRLALFTLLPAGIVGFLPARLVREPSLGLALGVLTASGCYALLASWVFSRGLTRYSSGSRFGSFG